IIDTAGIRETNDPVEREGVRRARARAAEADLVLWLTDVDSARPPPKGSAPVWIIRNKIDLAEPAPPPCSGQGGTVFAISARRGDGVAEVIAALVGHSRDFFGSTEGGLIARVRQRQLRQQAAAALRRSLDGVAASEELVAEDLRSAAWSLGRLLGQVDVEDILDVIFREFCIGK